jgi:hypothetical protein
MLSMTTPIVTELPLRMEAITADSFLEHVQAPQTRDHVMNYVECDLAADLTLAQRRHDRAVSAHTRRGLRPRFAPVRHHAALAV